MLRVAITSVCAAQQRHPRRGAATSVQRREDTDLLLPDEPDDDEPDDEEPPPDEDRDEPRFLRPFPSSSSSSSSSSVSLFSAPPLANGLPPDEEPDFVASRREVIASEAGIPAVRADSRTQTSVRAEEAAFTVSRGSSRGESAETGRFRVRRESACARECWS